MNKQKLNYLVDFLALVSFLVTAVSGLVLKFYLPSGAWRGGYREFIGVQKSIWLEIHDWFGIVFILLTVIHFTLHWGWIVCMTKDVLGPKKNEAPSRK